MTLTNRHYDKNLLFIMMIGLVIYFFINSCQPPYEHVITPSERESIARAKADSLYNDSLQKAIIVTIRKDSLNIVKDVDTTKKQ